MACAENKDDFNETDFQCFLREVWRLSQIEDNEPLIMFEEDKRQLRLFLQLKLHRRQFFLKTYYDLQKNKIINLKYLYNND